MCSGSLSRNEKFLEGQGAGWQEKGSTAKAPASSSCFSPAECSRDSSQWSKQAFNRRQRVRGEEGQRNDFRGGLHCKHPIYFACVQNVLDHSGHASPAKPLPIIPRSDYQQVSGLSDAWPEGERRVVLGGHMCAGNENSPRRGRHRPAAQGIQGPGAESHATSPPPLAQTRPDWSIAEAARPLARTSVRAMALDWRWARRSIPSLCMASMDLYLVDSLPCAPTPTGSVSAEGL
jgi:hypothetical protein